MVEMALSVFEGSSVSFDLSVIQVAPDSGRKLKVQMAREFERAIMEQYHLRTLEFAADAVVLGLGGVSGDEARVPVALPCLHAILTRHDVALCAQQPTSSISAHTTK